MEASVPNIILFPALVIAGRSFSKEELDNLLILYGRTTVAQFATFRKGDGTPYAPSGVNFRALAFRGTAMSTITASFQILYGDNDVGWASGSGPTNPVEQYGGVSTDSHYLGAATNQPSAFSKDANEWPLDFLIPDGKFVAMHQFAAVQASGVLIGIEEAL